MFVLGSLHLPSWVCSFWSFFSCKNKVTTLSLCYSNYCPWLDRRLFLWFLFKGDESGLTWFSLRIKDFFCCIGDMEAVFPFTSVLALHISWWIGPLGPLCLVPLASFCMWPLFQGLFQGWGVAGDYLLAWPSCLYSFQFLPVFPRRFWLLLKPEQFRGLLWDLETAEINNLYASMYNLEKNQQESLEK